ncbi:MAG: hypothetical protein M3362_24890 [Acidobacteriota bacterium]|nr:hypothetical protein [Acidobacteriota bacterium]
MRCLSTIAISLALFTALTIQAYTKEMTIRGRLQPTVEAGGWLVIVETDETTTKYLLLNARRFQNKRWFRAGATVEVTGETKPDAVTIYQEGIPFEARTVRFIGGGKG